MEGAPDHIRRDVDLASMTTLGLGGAADYFSEVYTRRELVSALTWAADRELPVTVIGGGSNVVVPDLGVRGLVVRIALRGVEVVSDGDGIVVRAGAGEPWDPLVRRTVAEGWAGFECLSGIPGSVGATPIQNVGAYGQEVAETLTEVELLDRATLEVESLPAAACGFAYRESRFKGVDLDRWVILAVSYRLRPGGSPRLVYPELVDAVERSSAGPPTLASVRSAVLGLRRGKGMVVDPRDPDSRSVGSFFLNPIVDGAQLERLEARSDGERPVPRYPHGPGEWKIPAAWLIERAGFAKGTSLGGVGISSKHTLALVHRGGGSTEQLLELAERIRVAVEERFGLALRPEPRILESA